jgi:mRNA-degrading endonuclease HigB of HigAB toxin-antitoxin module
MGDIAELCKRVAEADAKLYDTIENGVADLAVPMRKDRVAELRAVRDEASADKAARKAKVLNRERVRFEVAGGNYRLVAAFDFRRQIAFVKFIGTHAEYNRIDALKVSQF